MIYSISITNIDGSEGSTSDVALDISIDVTTNTAVLVMPQNQSILPSISDIASDTGIDLDEKAIKTINNISSFYDGAFNILGSQCVSIHQNLQIQQSIDQLIDDNIALDIAAYDNNNTKDLQGVTGKYIEFKRTLQLMDILESSYKKDSGKLFIATKTVAREEQVNLDIYYDLSEQELNKKSSLLVYDGCTACQSCSTLWKLHEALQEARLWAVGMKDCILYNQDTAELLWNNTLSLEGFSKTQQEQSSTTQSPLCFYNYNITNPDYRKTQFIKAMQLLHQYKATVALWNYLCFLNTSQIQIVEASQDWAGFVIQAKKTYNNCDAKESTENNVPVTLYLDLQLTEGQIAEYLQAPSVLQKRARQMLLFASVVDQNTYIEIGTDSGGHSTRTYSYQRHKTDDKAENNGQDATKSKIQYHCEFNTDKFQPVFCSQQQSNDNQDTDILLNASRQSSSIPDPPIRFKFQFKNLPTQRLILSASIKILPVVVYYDTNNYRIFENIQTYTARRLEANAIAAVEQTKKNRWAVTTGWKQKTQVGCIRQETRYYTTGFCRYPSTILQDFEQQSNTLC